MVKTRRDWGRGRKWNSSFLRPRYSGLNFLAKIRRRKGLLTGYSGYLVNRPLLAAGISEDNARG